MKRYLAVFCVFLIASLVGMAETPYGDLLEGVAPGPDGKIDVVSFTAHPDDESIATGGALAKLKKDPRVRLHIVCMTNGDMSDARLFMRTSKEEMARIRAGELKAAGEALGADEVIQLPYHDQGLKRVDQDGLVREVVELMERTGAEVVIPHDPSGLTHHPDHVTCSRVVTEAFKKSTASRLYYYTLPYGQYLRIRMFSPFFEHGKHAEPTMKVDVSAEAEQKKNAIFAHVSQTKFSLVGLTLSPSDVGKTEYFILAGEK